MILAEYAAGTAAFKENCPASDRAGYHRLLAEVELIKVYDRVSSDLAKTSLYIAVDAASSGTKFTFPRIILLYIHIVFNRPGDSQNLEKRVRMP